MKSLILAAGLCFATLAAHAASVPAMEKDGVLVDNADMTLYVFDKDPTGGGVSKCNGQCAHNWPPLAAAQGTMAEGDWSVVTRDDGSSQWAYKGRPVYRWIKDQKPGDKTGDGVLNLWHVAKP